MNMNTNMKVLDDAILQALADKAEFIQRIVYYMKWSEILLELGVGEFLAAEVKRELKRRGVETDVPFQSR